MIDARARHGGRSGFRRSRPTSGSSRAFGVFGTMVAEVLHVGLGVPYFASSALSALGLVAVFVTWQKYEKTLSIHSVDTARREAFYWAAVVATFALRLRRHPPAGGFDRRRAGQTLPGWPGVGRWQGGLGPDDHHHRFRRLSREDPPRRPASPRGRPGRRGARPGGDGGTGRARLKPSWWFGTPLSG